MYRFAQYALRFWNRPGIRPAHFITKNASTASILTPRVVPAPDSAPPLRISLRDYQEECIQSVLQYCQAGHKRLGVSLATGSGKTVIFTQLIDRIPPTETGSQTLILAHRRELVEQAARHCTLAYPDKHVDIELGKHHASGAADITVASIQSIMSGNRISKFDPLRYKLILVDETHHIVSEQYLELLEHFSLRHAADWTQVAAPTLVGFSATLSRFDGKRLGAAIDQIVFHKDYVDMIEEGWLSNVVFTTVEMKADLRKVGSGAGGDFKTSALSMAINTEETNELVVRSWLAKGKGRKSTIAFCVDLKHVTSLTTKFRQHGVDARFVTGSTPTSVRAERIESFKNGEYPVLLNCGVFTEGTDIPNIDCVLLARPTKSRNLLVQMIGRGMRLHKEKENCHIIDMVSTLNTGVVSTPTLFGLDPAEIVEYADEKKMAELRERKEQEKQREKEVAEVQQQAISKSLPGTVTFTDYDSVHDFIGDTTGDRAIRSMSQYAWVAVGGERFVLTTNNGNYLIIEPTADGFEARYYRKLPPSVRSKSPYATPKVFAKGDSLEHVVHAADTFAAEVFEHLFIFKYKPWRRTPASDAQLKFLNKLRPANDQLQPNDLTKGKAGDMITKFKHGAKGNFDKAAAKKKSAERVKQRSDAQRKRLQGQVEVGPLLDDMKISP